MRARSEAQKLARRQQILDAAVELLGVERYDTLTMSAIARACGVAKGTLYLYFPSKEALFLAALEDRYVEWLEATAEALDDAGGPLGPDAVATILVDVVQARPRFLELLSLVHGVLEQNAPVDAVYAFKQALVHNGLQTAQVLHRVAPWLPPQHAARFLLRLHAMLCVVHEFACPAPVSAELIKRPELSMLDLDFFDEMQSMVADLLRGTRERAATT